METAYERANDLMEAIYESPVHVDNPWKLAQRLTRQQDRKPGQVLPIYIAVQGISRHFGGPEEGGWYYNNTHTEEVFKFWTAKDALVKLRELKEEYLPQRFDIYSAANGGAPDYQFVVTHDPSFWEARENTERPHYE
jgi:hypothetical protein